MCYLFGASYQNCIINNFKIKDEKSFYKEQLINFFEVVKNYYYHPEQSMQFFDDAEEYFGKRHKLVNSTIFASHMHPPSCLPPPCLPHHVNICLPHASTIMEIFASTICIHHYASTMFKILGSESRLSAVRLMLVAVRLRLVAVRLRFEYCVSVSVSCWDDDTRSIYTGRDPCR